MKTANKHFKFINSQTGNAVYYHSVNGELNEKDVKAELDKIKIQVAVRNGLFVDIIYWEEEKPAN